MRTLILMSILVPISVLAADRNENFKQETSNDATLSPHYLDEMRACVTSICGEAKNQPDWGKLRKAKNEDYQTERAYAENTIGPKLNEIMKSVDQLTLKEIDILKKAIQQNSLSHSKELNPIFNILSIYNFGIEVKDTGESREIDIKETEKHLKDISSVFKRNRYLNIIKEYYNHPLTQDFMLYTFGAVKYLKKKYPDLKTEQAIKNDAQNLLNIFYKLKERKLYKKFSDILQTHSLDKDIEIVQKAMHKENLTHSDLDLYDHIRNQIIILSVITEDPNLIPNLSSDPPESLFSYVNRNKIFEKLEKIEAKIKAGNTQEKEDLLSTCFGAYVYGATYSPAYSSTNFLRLATEVTVTHMFENVKHSVVQKFSDHSRTILESEMKSSILELPLSSNDFKDRFLALIEYEKKSIHDALNKLKYDLDPSGHMKTEAKQLLLAKLVNEFNSDSYSVYRYLRGACKKHDSEGWYIDRAYSGIGTIKISPESLLDSEILKGVVSHEWGHIIEYILKNQNISKESKEKFEKAEVCLNELHAHEPHPANQKYVSEDWADLVLALSANPNDKNLFCYFMKQEDNHYDIQSIFNNYESDTHSSNLFRLLHVDMVRFGSLRDECNSFLNKLPHPPQFKKCFH